MPIFNTKPIFLLTTLCSLVFSDALIAKQPSSQNSFSQRSLHSLEKSKAVKYLVIKKNILQAFNADENISPQDFLIGNYGVPNKNLVIVKDSVTKRTIALRPEVLAAYKKMHSAAKKDNVHLSLISGFRSYNAQKNIWNRKWKKALAKKTETSLSNNNVQTTALINKLMQNSELSKEILKQVLNFSAAPGLSRHHWGTEIDINSLENSYFLKTKEGRRTHAWLSKNAQRFGFILTYHGKREGGHKTELWHYSYYPSSIPLTAAYDSIINKKSLNSFFDGETLNMQNIYEEYFFSLSPQYIVLSEQKKLWPR